MWVRVDGDPGRLYQHPAQLPVPLFGDPARVPDEMSEMCGDILESEFGKRYNLADSVESSEWLAAGAVEKCGAVIKKGVRIAAEIMLGRAG
jgi:hypothetical protein